MTPVDPQVLQALSAGIKAEAAAYVFYVTAGKKPQAAPFREVLDRMAHEEKEHFHILERQHDSLIRSEKWISTADILKQEGLPEIPEDMKAIHHTLIEEVEQADSARAVLDIAYRLEEDAYQTYQRQSELTNSDDGKRIFSQLAKFEQGHMRMVQEMMKQYT